MNGLRGEQYVLGVRDVTVIRSTAGRVLYEADVPTLREAVEKANLSGATLSGATLSGANLRGADLRGVDLSGADLRGVDLSGADLRGANLSGANLRGAYLSDADLRYADISGVDISGANLRGANLRRADLSGVDLRGAKLLKAPVVPQLHTRMLAAISAPGAGLNMGAWHSCETTHCRAGWAVVLAGEAGRALENDVGPAMAGALITLASCPWMDRVPDFYESNEDALASIKDAAAKEGER